MSKKFLEIVVDKTNEKGPEVFHEILTILHKIFKGEKNIPVFSFEIVKVGNRIRFFLVCEEKFAGFIMNQIYAHYANVEIIQSGDILKKIPSEKISVSQAHLTKHYFYTLKTFLEKDTGKSEIDPFGSITSALARTNKYSLSMLQVNFKPISPKKWKANPEKIVKIIESGMPDFLKQIYLNNNFSWLKILFLPFSLIFKFFGFLINGGTSGDEEKSEEVDLSKYEQKLSENAFDVQLNIIAADDSRNSANFSIKEIFSTLGVFENPEGNGLDLGEITQDKTTIEKVKNREIINPMVLSSSELAGFVHMPTAYVKTPYINWVSARAFEPPSNLPIIDPDLSDDKDVQNEYTPIGKTNFRGNMMSFGIKPDDRRRHMYIIGKTGMGKSVLLENMIMDDIKKGRGVAVIDPHGDLAHGIVGLIPSNRTNDTIIIDPNDKQWPVAFNMFENVKPDHRGFVASGIVSIFKRIFGDSWGPRLEHTLRNTVLALMEYPGSTLISIPLMLTSEVYRSKVVRRITDPVVKKFWTQEFAKLAPNAKVETAGPILNKVGQFLSVPLLRNVLGQSKNSFSLRWAMDKKKIIIVNLGKGEIGEDASGLLGSMFVTKFQLDAMSRADTPEHLRTDFYLYVDEFQNFATDSFATILSEARKYKLNLVMANQYIDQMTENVRGAVFGNVGTLVSFQVGHHDSKILAEAFSGDIVDSDLMNQKKYTIYLKELIDGMPSNIFSASTFPPYKKDPEDFIENFEKIRKVSRQRYAKSRDKVEGKISSELNDLEKQEADWEKKKEEYKQKKKKENMAKHEARYGSKSDDKKDTDTSKKQSNNQKSNSHQNNKNKTNTSKNNHNKSNKSKKSYNKNK